MSSKNEAGNRLDGDQDERIAPTQRISQVFLRPLMSFKRTLLSMTQVRGLFDD